MCYSRASSDLIATSSGLGVEYGSSGNGNQRGHLGDQFPCVVCLSLLHILFPRSYRRPCLSLSALLSFSVEPPFPFTVFGVVAPAHAIQCRSGKQVEHPAILVVRVEQAGDCCVSGFEQVRAAGCLQTPSPRA